MRLINFDSITFLLVLGLQLIYTLYILLNFSTFGFQSDLILKSYQMSDKSNYNPIVRNRLLVHSWVANTCRFLAEL